MKNELSHVQMHRQTKVQVHASNTICMKYKVYYILDKIAARARIVTEGSADERNYESGGTKFTCIIHEVESVASPSSFR